MTRGRAKLLLAAAGLCAALAPGAAYASWTASGAGSGAVKAAAIPTPAAPAATAAVHSVTMSWNPVTIGGRNVAGYTVKRYNASGTEQTVGSGCAGTIAGVTCTETAVPGGNWRYTVTPTQAAWAGAESPQSAAVTVQAAGLTVTSSTTVTSLPATLTASVTNYMSGQTVKFRLDDPTSGTLLTGSTTPASMPASGAATASVTIPSGTANGDHTLYATDAAGDVAGASVTVSRPVVAHATIAKSAGGTAGYVKQDGTYYVYADVTGSGSPPAGVSNVTADASAFSSSQAAAALTSGSYTVDGQSYNYRSAQLTAKSTLTAGSKTFTVSLTETGGTKTQTSYSATVDNTPPRGAGIQTANAGGGTVGEAELGDTLTLTYSEPVDPSSLFSGWDGSEMNVTVVLLDGGNSNDDTIQMWDLPRLTQIRFGTIDLGRKDYLTHGGLDAFGFTGTPSTMTVSGSTVTITLGTPSFTADTVAGSGVLTWTPSASATDRAGNAAATSAVTESGAGDKDF